MREGARTFEQKCNGPSHSMFPLGQSTAIDIIQVPNSEPGQEGEQPSPVHLAHLLLRCRRDVLRDIRAHEVYGTKSSANHKRRKDGLVVHGVPVYGTVTSGRTAVSAPIANREKGSTYYEMGNSMLKAMRGITPWPVSSSNPFRESDKINNE